MTTAPLLVVQTFYVDRRRGAGAHFEIHLAPALPPRAPRPLLPRHLCHRCTVLVTAAEALYQAALDAEGTPQRLRATWHPDGRAQVLDRLELAPLESAESNNAGIDFGGNP